MTKTLPEAPHGEGVDPLTTGQTFEGAENVQAKSEKVTEKKLDGSDLNPKTEDTDKTDSKKTAKKKK